MRMILGTLMLISVISPVRAQLVHPRDNRTDGRMRWWKRSAVMLAAAGAVDAASSYGRAEVNPVLRGAGGRFSAKSVGIKAAITGGGLLAQWLIVRKNPETAGKLAIVNVGMSGALGGVAAYNWSNAGRAKRVNSPALASSRGQ